MSEHVVNEESREHVTWWDADGAHCSEPDCEINERRQAMSDIVAEITYHIEHSGMSDRVTLDVGVLEHWRKEYAALKQMAEYGEMEMRKKYETEAELEKLLSQLNHLPSNHRTFDAYKQETLKRG